jgi:hypothetical protein
VPCLQGYTTGGPTGSTTAAACCELLAVSALLPPVRLYPGSSLRALSMFQDTHSRAALSLLSCVQTCLLATR